MTDHVNVKIGRSFAYSVWRATHKFDFNAQLSIYNKILKDKSFNPYAHTVLYTSYYKEIEHFIALCKSTHITKPMFKVCKACMGTGDAYADGQGCQSCMDTGQVPNKFSFYPMNWLPLLIALLLTALYFLDNY
jgi:hypothetical protein